MGTERTLVHHIYLLHQQKHTSRPQPCLRSSSETPQGCRQVYPAQVAMRHVVKQQSSPLCLHSTIFHQGHLSQCQTVTAERVQSPAHCWPALGAPSQDCPHPQGHTVPSCPPSSAPVTLFGDPLSARSAWAQVWWVTVRTLLGKLQQNPFSFRNGFYCN